MLVVVCRSAKKQAYGTFSDWEVCLMSDHLKGPSLKSRQLRIVGKLVPLPVSKSDLCSSGVDQRVPLFYSI